jgi:hypothetical protein
MRKANHTNIPFEAILFASGLIIGIAVSAMGESTLIMPMGISQSVADGLYVKQDGSLDPDMTGNLAVKVAGNPGTFSNTTDAASNVAFQLYSNRGTGVNDDKALLDVYFDDDASSKTLPGSLFFQMEDADAKGGTFGGFGWQSGSGSPVTNFFCSGNGDNVQANFYGLLADPDTGWTGGVGLGQFKTSKVTRWEINESGGYVRAASGFGAIIDGKFAVGTTLGALDDSVLAEFKSTTLGTIPAPKMTTAQRSAITTPDTGLQADDSDINALTRYNGSGWDIVSVNVKSGTVAGASFAGNPKIYTVTFGTAFPDTNYSVAVISEESRSWTFQSKLAGSFVMNSNANLALALNVDWIATPHSDP